MAKIARFQMPDGRIARFSVPDDATPEQAQALMQNYVSSNPETFAAPKGPEDTGFLGALKQGASTAIRELGQTAQTVTGGTPEAEAEKPKTIAERGFLEDASLAHPLDTLHNWTEKALYGLAKSSPTIAGSIIGTGLGAAVPIAGETGISEVAGAGLGAAAGNALQTLGPYYAEALKEYPGDPDAAFDSALKRAADDSALTGVSFAAFELKPFAGAVKNLLAQAFGVQPAISTLHQAGKNLIEGKDIGEGITPESYAETALGTALPAAAMHGVSAYRESRLEKRAEEAAQRAAEETPGINEETGQMTFAPKLFGEEAAAETAEAPTRPEGTMEATIGDQTITGTPTYINKVVRTMKENDIPLDEAKARVDAAEEIKAARGAEKPTEVAPTEAAPEEAGPTPYSGQEDMFGAPTGGLFGEELLPQRRFDLEAEAKQREAAEALRAARGEGAAPETKERIQESAGNGVALQYPDYKTYLEETEKTGMSREDIAEATGIKNEQDFLNIREQEIQQFVETPAQEALRRVYDKGGKPYSSNAYGPGERGVLYTDKTGEERFEPIEEPPTVEEAPVSRAAETMGVGQDKYIGLVDAIHLKVDPKTQWITPNFVARELNIDLPQAKNVMKDLETDGYISNPNKSGWYKPTEKVEAEAKPIPRARMISGSRVAEEPIRRAPMMGGRNIAIEEPGRVRMIGGRNAVIEPETGRARLIGGRNLLAEETVNAPDVETNPERATRPIGGERLNERGVPTSAEQPVQPRGAGEPSVEAVGGERLAIDKPVTPQPVEGAGTRSAPLEGEDRARLLRMPYVEAKQAMLEANEPNVRWQMAADFNERADNARRATVVNETKRLASLAQREAPTRSERAVESIKSGNLGEALYHLTNEAGGRKQELLPDQAQPYKYNADEVSPLRYLAKALFNTIHRGDIGEREQIISAEIARRSEEVRETQNRALTDKEKRDIRNRVLNDHKLTKVDVLDTAGKLTPAGRIIYKAGKNGKPVLDEAGKFVRNFTPDTERLVPITGKAKFNTYSGELEALGGARVPKTAFAGAEVVVEKARMKPEDKVVIDRLKQEGKLAEYHPELNKFYFTEDGLNDRTILHEMTHAATVKVLKHYENEGSRKALTESQRIGAQELHKIYNVAKKQLGEEHSAALENVYEFASHAATNKKFQGALAEIPAGKLGTVSRRAQPSLWNMFTRAVARMFGLGHTNKANEGNALLNASQAIHDILSTPEKGLKVEPLAERLQKQSEGIIEDDIPEDSGTAVLAKVVRKVQEARAAGKPKEELERYGNADLHLPTMDKSRKAKAFAALSKLDTATKDVVQDFWSLNQKHIMYGDKLPSIELLDERVNTRSAEFRAAQKAMGDQEVKWLKTVAEIEKKSPLMMNNFYDIALRSTLDQVEFSNRKAIYDAKGNLIQRGRIREEGELTRRFEALPKELRDMYMEIRDSYENMMDEYTKFVLARMGKDEADKYRAEYESGRLGVYLPLFRKGEFWLSYTDKANNPVKTSFNTEFERNAEVARVKASGIKDVDTYRNIRELRERGTPPVGFLGEILKTLKEHDITDPEILDAMYEKYLDYIPAGSLRQRMRTRERYLGMEPDIISTYANVAPVMARALNSLKHAAGIDEAMSKIKAEGLKNRSDENLTRVVDGIERQVNFIRNPREYSTGTKVAAAAGYGSYLWYLAGNASSALVNLTHLPFVIEPMLGGRYGHINTSKAMAKATAKVFHLSAEEVIPKGYEDLFTAAKKTGAIGLHVPQELFNLKNMRATDYTTTGAKIRATMDYMFRKTDMINREAALVAAYDLEFAHSGDAAAAQRVAIKLVKDGYGSALTEAGPRIMQNNAARVALTFKSFALNRLFILGRMFRDAWVNDTPRAREIAIKQILGIYGMAFLFSGVAGMPLVGLGEFLANQLGGDEDHPYDAEARMRAAMADWIYKGPIVHATNLAVSERTGWNDMIWKDDPRKLADVGVVDYTLGLALGPIYSAATQIGDAFDYYKQGEYGRMLESMTPVAIRNVFKAIRYAREGAKTVSGKPIGDVSAYNVVMQGLGFAPEDISERRAVATSIELEQKKILARKSELIGQAVKAIRAGKLDAYKAMVPEFMKFSQANPEVGITPDDINNAVASSTRKEGQSVLGINPSLKLRGRLLQEQGLDPYGKPLDQ